MFCSVSCLMPRLTAYRHLLLSVTSALLLIPVAHSEIREISPDELTEAYIKDTTVIIRRQQPQTEQTQKQTQKSTAIRVSPAQESFSPGETLAATETDNINSGVAADAYAADISSDLLDAAQNYTFSAAAYDELKETRDDYIRDALGLDPDSPVDYSSLQFPTTATPDNTLPTGTGYSVTPFQFSISVPNSGNYASDSFQTPNGEYQVEVTPDDITFTINIPQN